MEQLSKDSKCLSLILEGMAVLGDILVRPCTIPENGACERLAGILVTAA